MTLHPRYIPKHYTIGERMEAIKSELERQYEIYQKMFVDRGDWIPKMQKIRDAINLLEEV